MAHAILRKPAQVRVAPVRATTELIEQSVAFVPRRHKTRVVAKVLRTRAVARALVFTRTKHGADRLARQLHQAGIAAGVLHGAKSQSARQRTLESFRSGRTAVLVATDLAARGIDVEGISHVLNYDLPHEAETYVHRIGRAGRAGVPGTAIAFCDEEERKHLAAIQRLIGQALPVEKELSMLEVTTLTEPRRIAADARSARGHTGQKEIAHPREAGKRHLRVPGRFRSRAKSSRTLRRAL